MATATIITAMEPRSLVRIGGKQMWLDNRKLTNKRRDLAGNHIADADVALPETRKALREKALQVVGVAEPRPVKQSYGSKLAAWFSTETMQAREQLLSHIKATGTLAVELIGDASCFSSEYAAASGAAVPDDARVTVYDLAQLKHRRGPEYRVTFPIPDFPLPDLGVSYQTMFAGGAGRFTINSKDLFFTMIKEGMRL